METVNKDNNLNLSTHWFVGLGMMRKYKYTIVSSGTLIFS